MEARRHGGVVGPVILISLGVIFLLNNLGLLDWGVWQSVLRLWPVLLIAAGLDLLIGRRSALGSLIVAILLLGVLAGAIWLHTAQPFAATRGAKTIRQTLDGATRAEVTINPGVGELTVGPLTDRELLLEAAIDLKRGETLQPDVSRSGNTLVYTLSTESQGWNWGPWGADRVWAISLNPDIPLDLRVDLAVGMAQLDLSELALSGFEASTGMGQMVVTLPRHGGGQATIDGGIGQVVVRIPGGVAARVVTDTGLTAVTASPSFERRGDSYYTTNYENAASRIDVTVKLAIGHVRIEAASLP
jgi:hypothetical protein